jgi:TolB protein
MWDKLKVVFIIALGVSLVVGCQPKPIPSGVAPTISPLASPIVTPVSSPTETTSVLSRLNGNVAFHSDRNGGLQVYILEGKTGEVIQLTHLATNFEPSWSPDCQSLVFASTRDGANSFELYTMHADGSQQERLFENVPPDDWAPAWSPQGDLIAYQSNESGVINVCLTYLDGVRFGCMLGNDIKAVPSWSPDGNSLLFVSDRSGAYNIYATELNNLAEIVQITNTEFEDMHPKYSPDGELITFASQRLGNYDIYLMNADGTNEIQLTYTDGAELSPSWVGNDQIIYAAEHNGNWDIFIMNRDGSNVEPLIASPSMEKWPMWCPFQD